MKRKVKGLLNEKNRQLGNMLAFDQKIKTKIQEMKTVEIINNMMRKRNNKKTFKDKKN